jgi:hypothetical protein
MTIAYLYVLGASKDPDHIRCVVPWKVDEEEIFFGPCKIPLREELRPILLRGEDRGIPREDTYFVGFNSLPASRTRKVVWAGRMLEAMSFGRARMSLSGPRYTRLQEKDWATPLHLEPLDGTGRPNGYRHVGREHLEDDAWLADILAEDRSRVRVVGREVRLEPGTTWWDGFPRDVCFRFENVFFADGAGLEIDDELVGVLTDAQQDRQGVGRTAIFGLDSAGRAYGRRGRWLPLESDHADRLVRWLDARTAGRRAPAWTRRQTARSKPSGRCR